MNPITLVWLFFQQEPSPLAGLVMLVVMLAFYAFFAVCLQKIAEKTGTDPAWWAWVPILQVLLLLKIAGRPMWWIILCFIPLVSIVILIIVMVDVCHKRGKPGWLAVGLIIPLVNFATLGYLAFSD